MSTGEPDSLIDGLTQLMSKGSAENLVLVRTEDLQKLLARARELEKLKKNLLWVKESLAEAMAGFPT